jgi:cation diffusion facilitator CzcD-associated flavoprotein CzcO
MYFSEQQLKEFEDPAKYLEFRKALENAYWKRFGAVIKGSNENVAAKKEFRELMRRRLIDKPELLDAIVPDLSPHCRPLTPGPGYLEALSKPNVSFIQDKIKCFTRTGIETIGGTHCHVDAIICSTGANIDYALSLSCNLKRHQPRYSLETGR